MIQLLDLWYYSTRMPPKSDPPAAKIARASLILLVLINIVNFYDRQVAGALAEPMRREFGLSDTQLGLLGTVFTLLYAVVGLPLGRLADRISRRKLLAAGATVWGLLTAFAGWAWSFPVLVFSRLGVGVGEATCAPSATSWIGDLYPAKQRARPLALFMLGVPVGGALSFFFSGPIAQAYGWRRAMIAAAIPTLLLVPAILLLREPQRGAADITHPAGQDSIWEVLRIPTFWWIVASGALVNFNLYAVATFLPAFMGRIHHLTVRPANLACGVIYAVGGVLGGTIGGLAIDRQVRTRPGGRLAAAAVAATLAAPAAFFGVKQGLGSLVEAVALITVAYGLLNMYYGLVYASIQDIAPPSLRGTAMAIYFLVMYLGGASFGPVITGRLSDFLARRASTAAGSTRITEAFKAVGLQQAMLIIPALSLALGLVLWAGSRSMVRRQAAGTRALSAGQQAQA